MTTPLHFRAGGFQFQMGLRRGSDAFFRNDPPDQPILAERRHWLREQPAEYLAELPDARAGIVEAAAFAASLNPGLVAVSFCDLAEQWVPDTLFLRADEAAGFPLRAGSVCFPSHWALAEKMGLPLAAIHEPVPTLNPGFAQKIAAFLANLRPGEVWERTNWGLAATAERNDHPARDLPRLSARPALETCWLRIEHQAFRLLPASRFILFGIRIEMCLLSNFAVNHAAAMHLANTLESMPPEIAAYKGLAAARLNLAAQLAASANEGMIP